MRPDPTGVWAAEGAQVSLQGSSIELKLVRTPSPAGVVSALASDSGAACTAKECLLVGSSPGVPAPMCLDCAVVRPCPGAPSSAVLVGGIVKVD